jgi:hypothetical protein
VKRERRGSLLEGRLRDPVNKGQTGKRPSAQKTQSTRYGTEACLLLNQSTVPLGDNQPNGIERKSLEVKGPHLYLATCLLIWKTHGKVRHELVNLSAIEGKQDGS